MTQKIIFTLCNNTSVFQKQNCWLNVTKTFYVNDTFYWMHAVRQSVGQSGVYLCCDSYVFCCHAVTHKFVFISEVLPKQHKCMFLGKANRLWSVWFTLKSMLNLKSSFQWLCSRFWFRFITKTRLFKYIENFTSKNWKFSDKKLWYFFHISAQNIDRG